MNELRRHITHKQFNRVRSDLASLRRSLAIRRGRDSDKEAFVELENLCDEAMEPVERALDLLSGADEIGR